MRALALCLALCAAQPAPAEEGRPVTLDPAAVLALGAEPWLDRAGFRDRLDLALGGITVDMPRLPEALRAGDPFLWSLTGRFGAPLEGARVPGGLFACSRYGLATRDLMAETSLSDPRAFTLFGATQAAHDDAEAWPEAGLARVACTITWDDTRRVAIIPEGPASAALQARFDEVLRLGDAEILGDGWQDRPPRYGEDGYRLEARSGTATSVLLYDSAVIELTVGHQAIRFRAFLLNGGV
ncbi:hypothetical protein HKCCSP123_09435 [Rhodobacterales bacterium HKCCSP123]|nr:hypothetical protein [Rhodobacterales bacterium HKCCSP123]